MCKKEIKNMVVFLAMVALIVIGIACVGYADPFVGFGLILFAAVLGRCQIEDLIDEEIEEFEKYVEKNCEAR